MTAPTDIGATFLADIAVAFSERYPLVQIEMALTNRAVNLVDEALREHIADLYLGLVDPNGDASVLEPSGDASRERLVRPRVTEKCANGMRRLVVGHDMSPHALRSAPSM